MTELNNKETYEDVVKVLIERGWKKIMAQWGGESREYWYKRHLGVPRCACNSDKEGMQVVIYVYDSLRIGTYPNHKSYEIEVCGQKLDGAWIKMKSYAWEGGLLDVMDSQISQLLAGWTVFAKGNPV